MAQCRSDAGRSLAAALLAVVVSALLIPRAAAPQSFGESVDVRVVNVDVFVADKKGNPIEGLTRDDFVLYEDGVEVEITNFYAGTPAAAATRPTGDSAPEAAPEGEKMPLLAAERPPLWAVLYVDNFNLDPADRARIVDDLERFVAAQAGDDVRLLLATNDLGFRAQTDFTRDPAVLVAALEKTARGTAVGIQERLEYRALLKDLPTLLEIHRDQPGCGDPCPCAWGQMVDTWRSYAAAAGGRVGVSLNGLGELISSLGGLPGRKAVFYVSSGLMQSPGLAGLKYLGDLCPDYERNTTQEMWQFDQTSHLEELTARANANRVTLYALDGGGLRADPSTTVDFASARYRPSSLTHRLRTANLQGSLQFLAEQTGGRAILNANQPFDDLAALTADFESFYSLGFSPTRPADGKPHKLEVELADKRKAELRFRRIYRDKPLDERLGDQLMATLRFGAADNPLAVTAVAGTPVDRGDKQYDVPVHIRLAAERLVTAGQEGATARVRIFMAAEDERGRRSPLKEKVVELPVGDAAGASEHEMVVSMRLLPGPHRISIGVRDEIGVELSLLRIAVDVDPAAAVAAAAVGESGS